MVEFRKWAKCLEVPHAAEQGLTWLQNPDLEPMPPRRRVWGFWSYCGYWGIANISIGTWSVGAALLDLGLNVQHSMGALTVGNLFIVLYTSFNSKTGEIYHIGYTITQRMVFGIYGSGLGILIRIILSIVNYGSQAWIGALSFVVIFSSWSESYMNLENTFPESVDMTRRDFIAFLVFQVICIPFFFIKPERMNWSINAACIITFASMMAMWIYLMCLNGGPGPLYHVNIDLSSSELGWMWIFAMTTWYAGLSPSITNQADFSRFSSGGTRMHLGIAAGIFLTELIPLAGMLSASCSQELYGTPYWLPTDICMQWLKDDYSPRTRCACFFIGFTFVFSQLALNVLCNGFSGGMDLSGIFPRYINIVRGSILTALLSWAVLPWKFYNASSIFLSVMNSFGVVVTPIIAIMVADFSLVRKQKVIINDLYDWSKNGSFYFTWGVNWRAMAVFFASVIPGLPGIAGYVNPSVKLKGTIINFFYGSMFFSFVAPLVAYYILAVWIFPIKEVGVSGGKDTYNAYTLEECKKLNLEPYDGFDPNEVIVLENTALDDSTGTQLSSDHGSVTKEDGVTVTEKLK